MHAATVILDGANAVLILMLVALGLAIVFGLMNVINLAHGEFLMLGAYLAYWGHLDFRSGQGSWARRWRAGWSGCWPRSC